MIDFGKRRLVDRILLFVLICTGSGVFCRTSSSEEFTAGDWQKRAKTLSAAIEKMPDSIALYSQRGDAHFFLSEFDKAVADYEKMVEIDSKVDVGHWRLGIAFYFAGKYESGAKQFGKYHQFDQIDRENGIWRFLCQAKTIGVEKASKQLIEYEKKDREPLPAIYEMFRGKLTAKQLLEGINSAKISDRERQKRLFYANMYVGFAELSQKNEKSALPYFKKASESSWPSQSGYGPNYMQHVSRIQYDLLILKQRKANSDTRIK